MLQTALDQTWASSFMLPEPETTREVADGGAGTTEVLDLGMPEVASRVPPIAVATVPGAAVSSEQLEAEQRTKEANELAVSSLA